MAISMDIFNNPKLRAFWLRFKTPLVLTIIVASVAFMGIYGYQALKAPLPPPKVRPCIVQDIGPEFRPEHGTLRVFNGTERNGYGRRIATMLRAEGFRVIKIGNAPEMIQGVTVEGVAADSPEVKLVMSYFPKARFIANPKKIDHTVDITIGEGWEGLSKTPLASVPLPDGKACISPIQATQDSER